VTGDPGLSNAEFRRYAHLRAGSLVDHDTSNRALDGVLKHYQKEERLEAEIKLESQPLRRAARRQNYHFAAARVHCESAGGGAAMSREHIRRVIPIFEEGAVDDDLLNEGNRRLRDYYQRLGYFDVKAEHEQQKNQRRRGCDSLPRATGPRRKWRKYRGRQPLLRSATLEELLSVHAADTFDREGSYSQALVAATSAPLEGVYQNNGFSKVKVTAETSTPDSSQPAEPAKGRSAPLTVLYRIDEGQQLRVGTVRLEGNDHVDAAKLTPLLNTSPGQLLSPQNLASDRDALLTDYLSRGFDQVRVEWRRCSRQLTLPCDVVFHITEGQQIFVRKVLLTGLITRGPTRWPKPSRCIRAIRSMRTRCLRRSAISMNSRSSTRSIRRSKIRPAKSR